jgi:acetylglutamate kinase
VIKKYKINYVVNKVSGGIFLVHVKSDDFQLLNESEIITNLNSRYKDKVLVIKYGGNAMVDNKNKLGVIHDIALLKIAGIQPVLVHGGGPAISEHMERVGLEPEFVEGQRKTDHSALEIAEMVLCGKVNNDLVKHLNFEGARSIGLSGKDCNLVTAKKMLKKRKNNGNYEQIDLGQVGEVVKIDHQILDLLLKNEYLPVIAPIAVGIDNLDYNINADIFASEIASALNAEKLIYLTDVDGILRDRDDIDSRFKRMNLASAKSLLGNVINGGMVPKTEAAIKALEDGVKYVHIVNGMADHSLIKVFIDEYDIGTTIYENIEEVNS